MSPTIVVGYAPTREGEAALDAGVTEAALRGGRVVVVNASKGESWVDEAFVQGESLARLRSLLAAATVPTELRQPVRGNDPAEEIVLAAEELEAEFIVVGMRRRTPVGKLLMGSTAQRILLTAPVPVLAVKAPLTVRARRAR